MNMGIYGVLLGAVFATCVIAESTSHKDPDPIYFPDDQALNTISKRQINDILSILYQVDRLVDNRHTYTNRRPQQQQQFSASPVMLDQTQSTFPSIATNAPAYQNAPNQIVQYNNDLISDFIWTVFKNSDVGNPIGNLVLCPMLVQLLLSQMESAAAGYTKSEISSVIHNVNPLLLSQLVANMKDTKYRNELSFASAIFSANDLRLNDTFVAESKSRDVNVLPVNFENTNEALYTMNNWISYATKNQIRNLFKADHLSGLRLLLANTMYFRGVWKSYFNETIIDKFETSPKLHKTVTYMKKTEKLRGSEFVSASGVKCRWVELPYEGNEFSMLLVIPENRHSLENLIRQFKTSDILTIIGQLNSPHRRLVYLTMPKFSIQSLFSLKNVLSKMGLKKLFTKFSTLPYFTTGPENIFVSDIQQHSVLHVDEYGSIATSATTVSVVALSLDGVPRDLLFVADQPFLSIIVDKRSKVPLFIAKIFDP